MTLQELGELLRSSRQNAGLSLEEVNERTKISMFVLEALEKGDGSVLPHPVYTKGFIKNYARLLGLDEQRIVQDYLVAVGPAESLEIDTGVPDLSVRMPAERKAGSLWLVLLLLVGLAGVTWLAISYVSREIEPVAPVVLEEEVPGQPREEDAVDRAEVVPEQERGPSGEGSPAADTGAPGGEQTGMPGFFVANNTSTVGTNGTDGPAVHNGTGQSPSPDVVQESFPTDGEDGRPVEETDTVSRQQEPVAESPEEIPVMDHRLEIRATADCWLRAVADGESSPHKTIRLLRAGEQVVVLFSESVRLKLGNAGGVELFLDGVPYPHGAVPGGVETLEIRAEE
ncbi:helix-turn-helix domain-containing protein [Desulfoplanes sp.]